MIGDLTPATLDNIYSVSVSRQQRLLKDLTENNKNGYKELQILSQFINLIVKLKNIGWNGDVRRCCVFAWVAGECRASKWNGITKFSKIGFNSRGNETK